MEENFAWNLVVDARKADRPKSIDYIDKLFSGFIELMGDRLSEDDKSILTGIAWYKNKAITVIAFRKGKNYKENFQYNYGMANPSGYRKALRIAKQAEKFNRPIIIFIDTPGAYPGMEAEEKGQAEAIGKCLLEFSTIKTKIVSIIISEGCSGGALAFCVSDKLYMLENAYFSILSPEGYASILWKNKDVKKAAFEMNITSRHLLENKIIDGIISENNSFERIINDMCNILDEEIINDSVDIDVLIENRYKKFRYIEDR